MSSAEIFTQSAKHYRKKSVVLQKNWVYQWKTDFYSYYTHINLRKPRFTRCETWIINWKLTISRENGLYKKKQQQKNKNWFH